MKPIFRWTDYKTETGQQATSVELHINDMPCTRHNFPEALREEARRASRPLEEALREIAERQSVERHLVTGARLDPRKRHAVGTAMQRGTLDPYELRPYVRRSLTLDLPRILAVASVGVREVNEDSGFIGRMVKLTLAVAWACEATGAEVRCIMMEGHGPEYLSPNQPYRRAQLAYTLIEPDVTTPLQAYSVALNRQEFYGEGYVGAFRKDRESLRRAGKLRGNENCEPLVTFPGENGGYGVHWARTLYNPDIVIGIGKLMDINDADIKLQGKWDVKAAVEDIARQALRIAK